MALNLATDVTIEHYQRPEVKATILAYCMNGGIGSRALNSDEHWYKGGSDPKTVMLRGPADYEDTITKGRTIYTTLDILDPEIFEKSSPWVGERKSPERPIGDLSNCIAFTLSTDIDGIGDIRSLAIKEAVEQAAQFHIDYLRERGIEKNVHCLYSGGGIYVHLHHGLFAVDVGNTDLTPSEIKQEYQIITKAYNRLIGDISQAFFRKYPQYIGNVKFDRLNNQKRTFKVIFSVHKRLPYAVIPLDPKAIKINFEKASLPLSDEVLASGASWYQSFDPSEKKAITILLKEKMEEVKKIIRDRPTETENSTISRLSEPLDRAKFAPCMKNIIANAQAVEGRHRALGILATYLYQVGWSEDAAFDLWAEVADRCGVEPRIFETEFGRVSCPLCSTMQKNTGGYPNLNLYNLGFCVPVGECKQAIWPGDYGDYSNGKEPDAEEPQGPTVIDALKTILEHEADASQNRDFAKWEWRLYRPRITRAVKAGSLSMAGEKRAHKFLKKFKDVLQTYGVRYEDLYPLTRKTKSNKEEFSPGVTAKAIDILKNGDPVQFIADSCGEMVVGAETAFKKLTCCISVQNINQSAGLHPKLTGQSSGGKTWTIYGFAHHLPKEAVIKGSMSAKAGYYHNDGNRVLRILDDYQAGNEDLDTVIKQTSSEYHEPYTHRTVVKQAPVTLEIGSEQTWAITSVNNEQDIQVLNRSIPINVDDSTELTRKVNNRTVQRYGEGEAAKPVNESVLTSRCIFQILRDVGYIDVRIPFWARVDWIDTSNRRNPSLFMDLVIAHTAMFRYQRARDSEGYYLATEADFLAAKALFTDKDGEELVKRLTRRERDVLELLVANQAGLTRDDIAEKLEIAPQQVSQILGGRNGQGGLLQKVQIRETRVSEMIRINEDQRRTVHKIIYSLKVYDHFAGFDAVVKLKPDTDKPGNQRNNDESIDESTPNESSREDESKERKNKNKKEDKKSSGLSSSPSSSPEENILFRDADKNAFVAFAKADGNENDAFVNASPCFHESEDLSPDEIALLERIYGRLEKMDAEVTPLTLSLAMKANDHDIGPARCKAWLEATA